RGLITPGGRMARSQLTVFESMGVVAAVIVHGPVSAVSTVPAGTPVLPGPGQQPPHGSAAPGTFFPATGQAPDCGSVGSPVGLVGGLAEVPVDGAPVGLQPTVRGGRPST